jgi:endoglucanase
MTHSDSSLRDSNVPNRTQPHIPRWRGFNLTELADGKRGQHYQEFDFECMAEWGFNFARLPCSYWTWSDKEHWMTIDDGALEPLDQAIEFGQRYGIHTNIALHRIPGYCVNGRELEPYQLFDSPHQSMVRALQAAEYHWGYLSQRYKNVPTAQLSFDLLNEPPFMGNQTRYVEIARHLIATIRKSGPDRPIFVDGADIGQTPVLGLADQGIVQSTRGYLPKMVSHYTADHVPSNEFESFRMPAWPMTDDSGLLWNKETLRRRLIAEWQPLAKMGVPIHVGEWGCLNKTPHAACLNWMRDLLSLWKEVGWGWSMWNLRGRFGILDSGRSDVEYKSFRGHTLDRKMFELLIAN